MLRPVSYAINVTIRGPEVSTALSGEVPDGEYTVAGHDDDRTVQISVTRRGPDGRFIASATHTHGRET